MLHRLLRVTGLLVVVMLSAVPLARAQNAAPASSPEALAVAKELVTTIHLVDQFKALMPTILKSLKPAIVQGRTDVDRDYDAVTPVLLESFQTRFSELSDAMAIIYANNFTPDELRGLIAFYKSPVGQKLLAKTPAVTQQSLIAGQKFGQSVGVDMKQRVIEELRKKGHDL
ncbi:MULTISPECIES: DUF2059 domain-containing protein [Bradyrhizobium]|uniref:DUF2059 domain-containing protein n=1 Tax=Bradyrhizobium TaxID=374 RepID=UPI0007C7A573|nr:MULTISPECIES: DUF2059 domain-containing protein [Bradyrhizobium]PAY09453.1 DUF2059 domain-containing protein [Bradyrhizobium sp. UFLA03-84]